jgi:hypothetical protein
VATETLVREVSHQHILPEDIPTKGSVDGYPGGSN